MAPERETASRPRHAGLCIAIVGAESTGKTTLARELAAALTASPTDAGRRIALVEEVLRAWCDAHGRTPRPDEQQGILIEQHRRIDAAAATHGIVVCDTTGLMTHVYSDLLFDDRSLEALAVERHRGMTATLLTALDLPWVPDRGIRDGEHVRVPVDDRLRALLTRHALAFAVVSGHGPARLAQAWAALPSFPALRALGLHAAGDAAASRPADDAADQGADHAADQGADHAADQGADHPARPRPGLFSALLAAPPRAAAQRAWICDCCVPEAEQALLTPTRSLAG